MDFNRDHINDIFHDTVITCFPQRRECGHDDPDRYDMTDVLESILQNLKNISAGNVKEAGGRKSFPLLQQIINECVGACFDPMKNFEDDFKFLDMFSNSISRIVSTFASKDMVSC